MNSTCGNHTGASHKKVTKKSALAEVPPPLNQFPNVYVGLCLFVLVISPPHIYSSQRLFFGRIQASAISKIYCVNGCCSWCHPAIYSDTQATQSTVLIAPHICMHTKPILSLNYLLIGYNMLCCDFCAQPVALEDFSF